MPDAVCKHFPRCGFYKKFSEEIDRRDKRSIFNQYISLYCLGILQENCYRYEYLQQHGKPPADDITPTGVSYTPAL